MMETLKSIRNRVFGAVALLVAACLSAVSYGADLVAVDAATGDIALDAEAITEPVTGWLVDSTNKGFAVFLLVLGIGVVIWAGSMFIPRKRRG